MSPPTSESDDAADHYDNALQIRFPSMRSSMPVEYQTDANFTDDLLDLEDNYSRRNSFSEAEAEGIEFANVEAGSISSSNHNIEEGIEVQRRDDGVSGSGGGDPSIDRQFDPSSSNASSSSLPSNHHHRSSRKGWGWVSKSILWSVIVLLSVVVVCLFVVISQQKVEINYLKYEHSSLKEKYLRVTSSPPPGRSKQAKNKHKNKHKGSEEKSVKKKKGTPNAKKEECCACLATSSPSTSWFPSESPSESFQPSDKPSSSPTASVNPSSTPSGVPSESGQPSDDPSMSPSTSIQPSDKPSLNPSESKKPSSTPSGVPSESRQPSDDPSLSPSASIQPSDKPSGSPSESIQPSSTPSGVPSESGQPSDDPSLSPSASIQPSDKPSVSPSESIQPSDNPSSGPSVSGKPSNDPSLSPSVSIQPSDYPSSSPSVSGQPSTDPSLSPSASMKPSSRPSETASISDVLFASELDLCEKTCEKSIPLRWGLLGEQPSLPRAQAQALDWILSDPFVAGLTPGEEDDDARIIQRYNLAVLYYSTNGGDGWTEQYDWLGDSSECTWNDVVSGVLRGVICDSANRVVAIRLDSNNLTGSIPKEIGTFTELRGLYLYDNQLSGGIPREIGLLTKFGLSNVPGLTVTGTLSLMNNQLSGEIPPELGLLTRLFQLYLAPSNDFSGEIPSPICALRNTAAPPGYLSQLIAYCKNCPGFQAGSSECCTTCFGGS